MTVPQLQHMAPVLVVDRLEPCLTFWVDRFGFTVENQVPGPDGQLIFLPSFEGPLWYVVRAADGDVVGRITPNSGAHNTLVGPNGKEAYLAGLKSPSLTVVDTRTQRAVRTVGPFGASIRPFTTAVPWHSVSITQISEQKTSSLRRKSSTKASWPTAFRSS